MCSLISLTISLIFNVHRANHPSKDDQNVFITIIIVIHDEVFHKCYDERKF